MISIHLWRKEEDYFLFIALPCSKKSLMNIYGESPLISRVTNIENRKATPA